MTTPAADVQRLVTLVRAQFGLPHLIPVLTRLLAEGHPVTVEEAAAAGGWLDSHPEGTVAPVREDFDITRQAVIELGWTAG